jgi:putative hydrolase of HD superfamily
MIEIILETARLKALQRTGWVRKGVPNPETVAGHSWGISWLILLLLPEDLNRERALSFAVIHDLAEVRTGDFTPNDGISKAMKRSLEREALTGLLKGHDRSATLTTLWQAYEDQQCPESQFVKELDRLDMAIQAVVYAEQGHSNLEEFLDSAAIVIQHPQLRPLLEQLRQRLGY